MAQVYASTEGCFIGSELRLWSSRCWSLRRLGDFNDLTDIPSLKGKVQNPAPISSQMLNPAPKSQILHLRFVQDYLKVDDKLQKGLYPHIQEQQDMTCFN